MSEELSWKRAAPSAGLLPDWLGRSGIPSLHLERGAAHAWVVPYRDLHSGLAAQPSGVFEGPSEVPQDDQILILAADMASADLRALLSAFDAGRLGVSRPEWIAIPEGADPALGEALASQGESSLQGRLTVGPEASQASSWSLFSIRSSAQAGRRVRLGPGRIPEGPGNLEKRSGWFQKRTGRED